jgi:predicted metal-dependent TIM-barrel fold hydrolase
MSKNEFSRISTHVKSPEIGCQALSLLSLSGLFVLMTCLHSIAFMTLIGEVLISNRRRLLSVDVLRLQDDMNVSIMFNVVIDTTNLTKNLDFFTDLESMTLIWNMRELRDQFDVGEMTI